MLSFVFDIYIYLRIHRIIQFWLCSSQLTQLIFGYLYEDLTNIPPTSDTIGIPLHNFGISN